MSAGPFRRPSVRVLAAVGIGGALGTFGAGLATLSAWGPPGSLGYDAYELANRFAAVALRAMAPPPLALRAALAGGTAGRGALAIACGAVLVMAAGAAAEFWLFSTAPYQGPGSEGRLAAYLSFFVAGFVFLLAAARVGVALRPPLAPRWSGLVTLGAVVAGVTLTLSGGSLLLGTPLVAASLAVMAANTK